MKGGKVENLEGFNSYSYRLILADPPWRFVTRSPKGITGKSPEAHYGTMTLEDIKALPVERLADPKGCFLVMWTTWPFLAAGHAHDVMRAWGFTPKTGGDWAKQTRTGTAWQFGTGYVLRSASEPFLIGTIGKPKAMSRSERNLIVAPVQEHSRKPEAMYDKCEALSGGPYLEMFARRRRAGWDAFGDEL